MSLLKYLGIAVLIVLMGCTDSSVVYQKTFNIPTSGWDYNNVLEDSWVVTRPLDQSKIAVDITFSPEFGYQNLYLSGHIDVNGQSAQRDTFSVQLANPQGRDWLGQKNGDEFIVSDTLDRPISLHEDDVFSYQFAQFSRDSVLQGIHSVDIRIVHH